MPVSIVTEAAAVYTGNIGQTYTNIVLLNHTWLSDYKCLLMVDIGQML